MHKIIFAPTYLHSIWAQWYNTSMKNNDLVKARYGCSAAHYAQLPVTQRDEYCVMGRSNVGKSSFINHVFNDRGLARVSKKPGKTRLANFYEISDGTAWVDLPGYGFAFASKGERVRWEGLIEEYCEKRKRLRGCIWLLDIRHAGLPGDLTAQRWFAGRGLTVFPVLTKCDKLSGKDIAGSRAAYRKAFGFSGEPVLYSTKQTACRLEFWGRFQKWQSGLG
jgi:GTP-binding protein